MNKVSTGGFILSGLCIVGYVVCQIVHVDPGPLAALAGVFGAGGAGVAVKPNGT